MLPPSDPELQSLVEAVARRLGDAGLRLATAESCTGGWIAKACTDLPGSSRWFMGGVVAYADESKSRLLGVSADDLRRHGAVSEPVVRAMAAGALQVLGAEVGVAVSGIAGPDGGTAQKPVGTVWLAWARRDGASVTVDTELVHFPGDREAVRRLTVQRALQRLLEP
jgi:nicotinamide-nucleotide amidase